jgi:Flp pilus assembly protein TadD
MRRDAMDLKSLARRDDVARLPAATLARLGGALCLLGDVEAGVAVLRRGQRRYPDDFWMNSILAYHLMESKPPNPGEATRFYTAALALRPRSPGIHLNLGYVLVKDGRLDEAIAEFRRAIEIQPDFAAAHGNLGNALDDKGDVDEAIAEYREAIRLKLDSSKVHNNLGAALCDVKHQFAAAAVEFREAIRLKPDDAEVHHNLGVAMDGNGETDEAITEFREAIRLKLDTPIVHYHLGAALYAKGDLDGAIIALQRARDRATSDPRLLPGVESVLAAAEQAKRLAGRLPAVLRGDDRPRNVEEHLAFAAMCLSKKLDAAAARLYTDAFSAHPGLVDDRRAQHRYNAACAAALSGCGNGKDDPPPDDATRIRLREQALGWLRAELSAWKKLAMTVEPGNQQLVAKTLAHWETDPDLAGIRDATALAQFTEDERKAWQAFK